MTDHPSLLPFLLYPQASESALPADAYVVSSPCPAAAATAGSSATAVFTVGASVNPQVFKEVALQVDFPKALLPSATLKCQTSTAQGKHQLHHKQQQQQDSLRCIHAPLCLIQSVRLPHLAHSFGLDIAQPPAL